jgi:hypothetical protein
LQAIADQEAREREEAERKAEPQANPDMEPVPLPVMPAARLEPAQPIKSDFGTTVSGQKVWECEVEDYLVAFMSVSDNEKVREAIDKAIKGMVRGGMRKIEGVRIFQALKASNR